MSFSIKEWVRPGGLRSRYEVIFDHERHDDPDDIRYLDYLPGRNATDASLYCDFGYTDIEGMLADGYLPKVGCEHVATGYVNNVPGQVAFRCERCGLPLKLTGVFEVSV